MPEKWFIQGCTRFPTIWLQIGYRTGAVLSQSRAWAFAANFGSSSLHSSPFEGVGKRPHGATRGMGLARLAALGCAIRQRRARHYVELMHDAPSVEGNRDRSERPRLRPSELAALSIKSGSRQTTEKALASHGIRGLFRPCFPAVSGLFWACRGGRTAVR